VAVICLHPSFPDAGTSHTIRARAIHTFSPPRRPDTLYDPAMNRRIRYNTRNCIVTVTG
jgi:hypothetical protein